MISMPDVYVEPFGTPLYWMDEESGLLKAAMMAYVNHAANMTQPEPTAEQLQCVIAYFRYVVHAPCWIMSVEGLDDLRQKADDMKTVAAVMQWIEDCLDAGFDPI